MDKKNRTTTEEKDKKGYKEPPIDISCTSYTLNIQNKRQCSSKPKQLHHILCILKNCQVPQLQINLHLQKN